MSEEFEKRILQADRGKKVFEQIFKYDDLSLEDTFLLVLTDNKECIHYGIKYLPDFVKLYHRKTVYILLKDSKYIETFSEVGNVKLCKDEELCDLAAYLNVFHRKEDWEVRIIFLTEKDEYGLAVEELLKREEFTLEEYVAVSLFQIRNIAGDKNAGSRS